ncbi:CHAT domain-containing protein [Mycena maculata]|uniref:CHAT domain-containing protein n=1 Tax=Mycena maculata TaxID=230809 RepID=A0AAD7I8R4_9AGAR|nr:CHAT domain-containing protein [Mycena maculata]
MCMPQRRHSAVPQQKPGQGRPYIGEDSEEEASGYFNLAHDLLNECKAAGNINDLNTAIFLFSQATHNLLPAHAELSGCLNHLSVALATRFSYTGDLEDVHLAAMAILTGATAVGADDIQTLLSMHTGLLAIEDVVPMDMMKLASDILTHFNQAVDSMTLNNSIFLHREALAFSARHPEYCRSLLELSEALLIQFRVAGDMEVLEEVVSLLQELHLIQPNRWASLCVALITEDTQTSNQLWMQEILALNQKAIQSDEEAIALVISGTDFLQVFQQSGNPSDLDAGIAQLKQAWFQLSWGHPHHDSSLSNLASAVMTRFEQRGDAQDLDEAIQLYREALTLHPSPHPDRAGSPSNLANAVLTRFQQRGDAQDLDEAIQLHREALALCPSLHPDCDSSLNNLAVAVQIRFEHQGNAQDLDEAIQLHRKVLGHCPSPHSDRGSFLNNLANAVEARFEQQGDAQDLDEVIQLYQESLALFPSPHPDHGGSLNNLATAAQIRWEYQGNAQDFEKAIQLHREVLALCPSPHPMRGKSLYNLAILFVHSYEHAGDPNHLNDALTLLQEASLYISSSLLTRFRNTHLWARTAARYHPPSALPAYHVAINLLPKVAALHLDLRLRQRLLATLKSTDLVSGAAVCAVGLAQYATAVEFLEASRSVFWSQALHLRTPLNRLDSSHPDLASQIAALARELEQASFRETRRYMSLDRQDNAISIELEGARCHRLNRDWDEAINSVQMLPGFEDFMQPKGILALKQAAVHGRIIILNAGESSGHALLVQYSGEVQCVPLPYISQPSVKSLVNLLRALSGETFDIVEFITKHSRGENTTAWAFMEARLLGGPELLGNASPNVVFQVIFHILWELIVKPVLDALNLKKSANPPRLWWCPVGPLSFLPIHAAGIYDKHGDDCISDYVISSYTPTLTALLDPPTHSKVPFKMTTVIQPESKFSPLPGTRTELKRIQERVPEQWLTAIGDTTPATVATALAHLRESSIVHFACHGTQDKFNPLDSGLVLTDGWLKVSEIMRKPDGSEGIRKSMALAFLSACETAKGDDQVPDEAMHLAATLLFAGFRGVVATMWTMNDLDGPKIADTFYKHLFRNCDPTANHPVVPDLTEAACALHLAVAQLREQPDIPFMRWVSFVHYGL